MFSLIVMKVENENVKHNTQSSAAYGGFIFHIVKYARCSCSDYRDFPIREQLFTSMFLSEGYVKCRL